MRGAKGAGTATATGRITAVAAEGVRAGVRPLDAASPRTGRHRARRATRAGAVVAAALLLATACGGGDGEDRDRPDTTTAAPSPSPSVTGPDSDLPGSLTRQKVDWKDCPAPSALQGGDAGRPRPLSDGTPWECGELKAPLDYGKPGGETIRLALIRARSTAEPGAGGERIGSLVFNFGGPGGSGVATLPSLAKDYANLHARYDLVSFDPRGVGASEGVRCFGDKELDASNALDATPDDAAEERTALADHRRSGEACEKNSGAVLPHVGTRDAARDLDLMRQVLGDTKLHYFGISYGTELGGVYAHLFPDRVGRAVFDAVVDPTHDPEESALGQAKGFQRALDNFLEDCAKRGTACPVGTDPGRGRERITALLERLDKAPLPTPDGRKLTESRALNGIAQALYAKEYWPYLRQGLQETRSGTGDLLLVLADSMAGRDRRGRYSNIQSANTAVVCADSRQRYTPAGVKAALPRFRAASPVFGEFLAWGLLQCTDWPVEGAAEKPDVSAEGAAPILVVGTTGDPATPYEGARRMADGLGGDVGVQVTYRGEGHGAYGGGSCVTGAVDRYLLDGKAPADGKVCS